MCIRTLNLIRITRNVVVAYRTVCLSLRAMSIMLDSFIVGAVILVVIVVAVLLSHLYLVHFISCFARSVSHLSIVPRPRARWLYGRRRKDILPSWQRSFSVGIAFVEFLSVFFLFTECIINRKRIWSISITRSRCFAFFQQISWNSSVDFLSHLTTSIINTLLCIRANAIIIQRDHIVIQITHQYAQ